MFHLYKSATLLFATAHTAKLFGSSKQVWDVQAVSSAYDYLDTPNGLYTPIDYPPGIFGKSDSLLDLAAETKELKSGAEAFSRFKIPGAKDRKYIKNMNQLTRACEFMNFVSITLSSQAKHLPPPEGLNSQTLPFESVTALLPSYSSATYLRGHPEAALGEPLSDKYLSEVSTLLHPYKHMHRISVLYRVASHLMDMADVDTVRKAIAHYLRELTGSTATTELNQFFFDLLYALNRAVRISDAKFWETIKEKNPELCELFSKTFEGPADSEIAYLCNVNREVIPVKLHMLSSSESKPGDKSESADKQESEDLLKSTDEAEDAQEIAEIRKSRMDVSQKLSDALAEYAGPDSMDATELLMDLNNRKKPYFDILEEFITRQIKKIYQNKLIDGTKVSYKDFTQFTRFSFLPYYGSGSQAKKDYTSALITLRNAIITDNSKYVLTVPYHFHSICAPALLDFIIRLNPIANKEKKSSEKLD